MRLQIAVSDEMAERLMKQAEKLGVTRSAYCSMKLAQAVQADEQAWLTMGEMTDEMKGVMIDLIRERLGKTE